MQSQHHNTFGEIVQLLFSTANEKVSALIAAGMISTPIWDSWLRAVNYEASLLAAPLGVLWLLIQIGHKVYIIASKDRYDKE